MIPSATHIRHQVSARHPNFVTDSYPDHSSTSAPYKMTFAQYFPLKILLVEDSKPSHYLMLTVLRGLGYNPDSVWNGQEAVEKVKLTQGVGEDYDVIIMDLQMPRMDGVTATEHIYDLYNDLYNQANTPHIIPFSASFDGPAIDRFKAWGCHQILNKPFTTEDIMAILSQVSRHWCALAA